MQDLRSVQGGAAGRVLGEAAAAAAMGALERRLRPQPQQSLRCPRCDSLNTKFCYYNNYNLSQPRHFCKSCRRYWTNGGVLRNVPVGGGCRKPKRSPSSKSPKSSSNKDHRHDSAAAAADTREPGTPPGTTLGFDPTGLHLEMSAPPAAAVVFPDTGSFAGTDVNFIGCPQLHLLPAQQPKAATPPATAGMLDADISMPGMSLAPPTYVDQMAHIDATPLPEPDGVAAGPPPATLDWPAGGYYMPAGLLDAVPASVAGDHGGAWNYQTQWEEMEIDPLLFIP